MAENAVEKKIDEWRRERRKSNMNSAFVYITIFAMVVTLSKLYKRWRKPHAQIP